MQTKTVFLLSVLSSLPLASIADCPYVPERSAYVCNNNVVTTQPGEVTPGGEIDARSSHMIQQQNGYGMRRRGGCVPVIRGGFVSHYDCTTHALSQVPEYIERRQYQTFWEQQEERGVGSRHGPELADRLVPVFAPR